MELAIIILVLAVIGIFIWRSATGNKKEGDQQGGSNPNPNAPTSSRRL
jgi:hypothetical protein